MVVVGARRGRARRVRVSISPFAPERIPLPFPVSAPGPVAVLERATSSCFLLSFTRIVAATSTATFVVVSSLSF